MTLYAFLVVMIPYIIVGWRLNKSGQLILPEYKRLIKRIIIVLFIILNLLPFIILSIYVSGNIRDFILKSEVTWFDYLFIFPFWIGFLTIFELFFYFLFIELIQLIAKRIYKNKHSIILQMAAYSRIIIFVIFFIYVSYTSYIDTYTVRIDTYDLNSNAIPAELDGLTLALVGDIQIDRFTQQKKIDSFHAQLKEVNPDLLLFAGDLVTRGTDFIEQGLDVMCNTNAKIERIACVGDHDIWSDATRIAKGLIECGWTFLDNRHHTIDVKGRKVVITGITYVYSRRINPGQLEDLLKNAPESDLKILLVHQPSRLVIDTARRYNYDILLAGHTHGGQIVFKPFGFTITPTMFENSYFSGYYQLENLALFVTNGIGLTMMPLRFRAPAEIQKIRIVSSRQ
jgi:predicted MPP superfamily phosphohydrolase